MTTPILTATKMLEGIWEGILTFPDQATDNQPEIEATYLGKTIQGVSLSRDNETGNWLVQVPIPVEAIRDGVHSFLIIDKASGEKLNSFTIIAGEAIEDDIRSEIELLRAELDMLKKAFRRHCAAIS